MIRQGLKLLAWCVAALIAIPLLLAATFLIGANTGPGRHAIETATRRLTAGEVRIEGLAGSFPAAIRIRRLMVADAGGVWLTVSDAALDWSPRRLLAGEVAVDRLEARSVSVARLPEKTAGNGGFRIPALRGEVSRLRVASLTVDAAVSGRPIELAVAGNGVFTGSESGEAHLTATAPPPRDGSPPDRYLVDVSIDPAGARATLDVAERPHGLIAGLIALPDIGAITGDAKVDGPLNALATKAALTAGPLRASVDGTVDALARAGDLRFSVQAPAMTPGPGVGWSYVRLDGNVHGPLDAPAATGTLQAGGLTAEGAAVGAVRADIAGDASGRTEVHASFDGVRLPGPSPNLLASGPLTVDASIALAAPDRPARFTVRHALFSADCTADERRGQMRLIVPDLAPLAAIGGVDLRGHTDLDVEASRTNAGIDLTVTGGVGITGGMQPVPALIGDTGSVALAASVDAEDVTVSRFTLNGTDLSASASGGFARHVLNLDWTLALSDLSVLRSDLEGKVAAQGHAGGGLSELSAVADLTGNLAVKGERLEQVTAHVTADGLPNAPEGRLTAGGTFLAAPLDVAVVAARRNGGFHFDIDRAEWKSLTAAGTLDLAEGDALPTGKVTLAVHRLADLEPLLGHPIAGDISASLDSSPGSARVSAVATDAAMPGTASVSKAALGATIDDPTGHPVMDGTLTLEGVAAEGVHGSALLKAKGPWEGLALDLTANTPDLHGQPARVDSSGTLDGETESMSLAALHGLWGRETVRLLAPARIGFAQGIAVDRLRLGIRQGELGITGRWGGEADGRLNVTLVNLPADVAAAFAPEYAADGMIAGDARLTGTSARPEGTIHIRAAGLRLRTGPGQALPPATSSVDATLAGTDARVAARLTAGTSNVTMTGRVPLSTARTMDARVGGTVDLAMLNPVLTARGREVRGRLGLNLAVGGTFAKPEANGMLRLAGGDYQDASYGVHIASIAAAAQVIGETVRLDHFAGKAGTGTIAADGTVSLAATPVVALTVTARDAKVLATDLATAVVDADLTLRGAVNANPALGGMIRVRRADIQIPETLPPSIVVLPVRNAGAPPVKVTPPPAPPDIALNLTLDAPGQVYVRGRGVDAELGGRVTFEGTAAHPLPQGSLRLRRGAFSIAGQTLNLTEGTIDFSGGPLTDPTLDLVARETTATLTSTLTISGEVSKPKIVLSSVPDMPQDEILSQLLFNSAKSGLTPFQAVEVAAALASLSGIGSAVGDPLGGVRSALGLDQLGVGSDANGGPTLQAGRYLAPGVRVGASQSASGGGTQATVQIDIAKGLKLETTAGSGSSTAATTPGTSSGTGVGVTYQFEY